MLKPITLEEYRQLFKTKVLARLPLSSEFYDQSLISCINDAMAAYLHHQYVALRELERQTHIETASGEALGSLGQIIGITRGHEEDDDSLRFRIQRRVNTPVMMSASYYEDLIEQQNADRGGVPIKAFCLFSSANTDFLSEAVDTDTLRVAYISKNPENLLNPEILQEEPWIARCLRDTLPFQFKIREFHLEIERTPVQFTNTPTDAAEIKRLMVALRKKVFSDFTPFPACVRTETDAQTSEEKRGIGTTRVSIAALNEVLRQEATDVFIHSPRSIAVNADRYPFLCHESEDLPCENP